MPQLLNLLKVENVSINLPKIRQKDVVGWSTLALNLQVSYYPVILRQAPISYIAGIYYINSIYTIGSGITDLLYIPFSQIREDGDIFKGLTRGAKSFVKKLTKGGLDFGTRLVGSTSSFLKLFVGDTNEFSQNPKNTTEGLHQAYDSFTLQMKTAKDKIILMPLREYEKYGTAGYFTAVIKTVPIAFVTPVKATTDGVGMIMKGVGSQMFKNDKFE